MPTPVTTTHTAVPNDVKAVTLKLFAYCRAHDWSGYDPYDALNSPLLTALPLLNFRLSRLILTQFLKRSPVNIRRLFGIPKTRNPKAIALFLISVLKLSKLDLLKQADLVGILVDQLVALRSPGIQHWCWGYSFPWQTRTMVVPRGAPNLVCTTFVAGALLDAYQEIGDTRSPRDGGERGGVYFERTLLHRGRDSSPLSVTLCQPRRRRFITRTSWRHPCSADCITILAMSDCSIPR